MVWKVLDFSVWLAADGLGHVPVWRYLLRQPDRRSSHQKRCPPEKPSCRLLSSNRRECKNSHVFRYMQQLFVHRSFWKTVEVYFWQKQWFQLYLREIAGIFASVFPGVSWLLRIGCSRWKKPDALFRCNYPAQKSSQNAWKRKLHRSYEPHASAQSRRPRHTDRLHRIWGRWCSDCRKYISWISHNTVFRYVRNENEYISDAG